MMLATKAWYWNKLSTDASLLALLGGVSHISDMRPEVITVFPMVILTDEDHRDREYAHNKPKAVRQQVKADIYIRALNGAATTSTIGILIANIFDALFFTCSGNHEVPEPLDGVRHRTMRFSRDLFPSDLI
jgi:hypothetical protein